MTICRLFLDIPRKKSMHKNQWNIVKQGLFFLPCIPSISVPRSAESLSGLAIQAASQRQNHRGYLDINPPHQVAN